MNEKIAVIGLGYVGLPVAVEFGKSREVVGYDISTKRIEDLSNGFDETLEVDSSELAQATHLSFSHNPEDLKTCSIFIIAVPTPIDAAKRPELSILLAASETVGRAMRAGATVIYESTVYPGCTVNECVPVLEQYSGLRYNEDFVVGYSPERANPGDREHRLTTITKVTSGSTKEAAEFIDSLYGSIVTAGTHLAPSIEVAEAAKVIENTQRDVNIALMNELAQLFHKLGLDTLEVLEAAGTKWNFLPFRPGLVGGHCIGVDPYYLTHKAQEVGHYPEVILSGRRINDNVGNVVADRLAKTMMKNGIPVVGSRVLVLGVTFKENCPDIRNTRVIDIIESLNSYCADCDIWDPWADPDQVKGELGVPLLNDTPITNHYDAVVVAVAHNQFKELGPKNIRLFGKDKMVLFDLKSVFAKTDSDERL